MSIATDLVGLGMPAGQALYIGTSVSTPPVGSSGQLQYNNSGAFGGAAALTYAASGNNLTVAAQNAADVPLLIKGASSQSGNLLELRSSSNTLLINFDSSGNLSVPGLFISSFAACGLFYDKGLSANALALPGNGTVVVGNGAVSTTAGDGFLYIPTCAGTPTGTPVSHTGTVALVFDTTGHKFWIYDGAWKGGTSPGAWS